MATVSEAITALIDAIKNPKRFAVGGEIHAVVAAAEAQGFEKGRTVGAEQKRQQILRTSIGVFYSTKGGLELRDSAIFIQDGQEWWMVPASVLAPKEEP
jgi:hypothetical protein